MNSELHIKQGVRDMYSYRHTPENMRAFAEFYWRTLLYSASALALLAIGLGIWELSSVLQDFSTGARVGGSAQPVPALNKAQLKNTLENFQTREARFEALKTSVPKFTDPSK